MAEGDVDEASRIPPKTRKDLPWPLCLSTGPPATCWPLGNGDTKSEAPLAAMHPREDEPLKGQEEDPDDWEEEER